MVVVICGTVRADVELLAGDLHAAEVTLREQCELPRSHARSRSPGGEGSQARRDASTGKGASTRPSSGLGVSRANAASDDQSAQLILGPVEAKLQARRGRRTHEARELAEESPAARRRHRWPEPDRGNATRPRRGSTRRRACTAKRSARSKKRSSSSTQRGTSSERPTLASLLEDRGAQHRRTRPALRASFQCPGCRALPALGPPSACAISGAASASRPTASTTSVRCSEVTWRMIPSSRDSCVRRSRSIRALTARPRAANSWLTAGVVYVEPCRRGLGEDGLVVRGQRVSCADDRRDRLERHLQWSRMSEGKRSGAGVDDAEGVRCSSSGCHAGSQPSARKRSIAAR